MEKLISVVGVVLIIAIAFVVSKNKKEINWRTIGLAFIGEIIFTFLMIKTPLWKVVEMISNGMTWIISQSTEGINFVFGGLVATGSVVFFINSLLPIVFISAFIGILFHFNILQKFIGLVGNTLARLLKVDTLVAVNSITNMVLGQSESLFVTKSYLPNAKESTIFATMVGGMASVSASVMGLYASYGASMDWIIASLPMAVFNSFILTQILMPTKYDGGEIKVENDKGINVIDTMMAYANSGFKSVIGISVALMVFISVIGMINNFIGLFFNGITIQSILGYVFYPVAFLMGVPHGEISQVAQILATKIATNEAVAISLPQFGVLSEKAKIMATVSLMGFGGIGSIGILIGGYSAVAPNKVKTVAKLGVKALITATFVNILSGTIICLFL